MLATFRTWITPKFVVSTLCGCILLASLVGIFVSRSNTIRPDGIVIHHSAVPQIIANDARGLDLIHKKKGFGAFYRGQTYHIAYHFVILPNGVVETGRPEHLRGAHTSGYSSYLGICLIGDFSRTDNPSGEYALAQPTERQLLSLNNLIQALQAKYHIPSTRIFLHRELVHSTECPGDRFPVELIKR